MGPSRCNSDSRCVAFKVLLARSTRRCSSTYQEMFQLHRGESTYPHSKTPLRHLLAFKPLEVLGIDFLKMDRGKGGYENILVMSDVYTKYAQAIPCRDQTAHTVARESSETAGSSTMEYHYGSTQIKGEILKGT